MKASLSRPELGDALVDSVIKPGDDLWVRVDTAAWVEAGRAVRDVLGCTYFGFLSAIDWMPSPCGPRRGRPDRAAAGALDRDRARLSPGRATRFQVFARRALADVARRHHAEGRPAGRRPADRVVDADLRRRRLARARGVGDVRHRLRRPPVPPPHLPAGRLRGLPAAQGLPAPRPHGEAVAGHRRRRAHAGGRRRRTTRSREAGATS